MKPISYYKIVAGFSLIELVLALSIIVVLAALTYPSYKNSILISRRAEARSSLYSVLLQQERYYTQHNTYFAFDAKTPDSPFKWWSSDSIATSHYEIQARPCPNKSLTECVLLTAVAGSSNVRDFSDAVCGNLMLDSANNKSYSVSPEPNSSCW